MRTAFFSLCASACALTALPGALRAQEIDIPYQSFTLDNGLKVIVLEDHSDAVVSVNVSYHVGSGREELGKSGFAHLFEHMLFQGSEHVGDEMHFKYVTEAGGTLNGTTNTDRTIYFETLPSNQLETALWLEADRMGFLLPALTKAKLDNQIDVVKNERRQNYENRAYGQSNMLIVAALYPKEHPYSWTTIGSHQDLSSASLDDVKNFFQRWYGPNNATLAIGGDVKFSEVRTLVERWFGPIPRGPGVDWPAARPVKLDAVKRISTEDRVTLPQLSMNWPAAPMGSDDEAALDVLAEILTGNKSATLSKALTLDEQLATRVSASNDAQELAGKFSITANAQRGTTLDTLEERTQQTLAKLARDGVDPEAIERARTRYESDFVRGLETVAARTRLLAESNTLGGRPDAYKDTLARRKAVTAADVTRVLKHYVLGRPAVVLSTVPMGKLDMVAKDKPFPAPINEEMVAVVRDSKPAPGLTPEFHSPAVWHDNAQNGLTLTGAHWSELPLSTLSISVPAGRSRETLPNAGLSSLVASMMQQGTQALDIVAYATELDRLGADIRVSTSDDELTFTLSCLDAKLEESMKLLADVIMHPRFDAADFARLKKERTTALETRADNIGVITSDVFSRLMYGDDSVMGRSALGNKASVAAMKLEDVKAFWSANVLPSGGRVSYVGSLDGAALKRALGPLGTAWKGSGPNMSNPSRGPVVTATHIYLVDKPGAAQSEVRIGHMGPSSREPDFYALGILNYPLGGSFSSRINLNLREAKGYTYGARSSFEGGPEPAPFVASGAVKTDVTAESVVEFMKELKGILTGVKPEELAFTKDALAQGARRQYESTGALLGLVENVAKYRWKDDYPARRLSELDAMTVDRLNALAKTWIHPEAMVILVVGDKAKVGAKLAELGYGPPIELDIEGNRIAGG